MNTHLLTSPFGEISVSLDSATTGRATAQALTIHRVQYRLEFSFEVCDISERNPEGIRSAKGCYLTLARTGTSAAWGNASSAARKKLSLYLFPLLRGLMSNPQNVLDAHMASIQTYHDNVAEYIKALRLKLAYADERFDEYDAMKHRLGKFGRIEDAPFCGKPEHAYHDAKPCKRPQGHPGKCDHMTTFYVRTDGC